MIQTEPPIPEIPKTTKDKEVLTTEEQSTTWVEEYLPSPAEISTTTSIAVIATGAAAATPLLLRVVKPVIQKAWKTIQKKLGKKITKPTRQDILTDEYRKKKGLSPLKKKSR